MWLSKKCVVALTLPATVSSSRRGLSIPDVQECEDHACRGKAREQMAPGLPPPEHHTECRTVGRGFSALEPPGHQ